MVGISTNNGDELTPEDVLNICAILILIAEMLKNYRKSNMKESILKNDVSWRLDARNKLVIVLLAYLIILNLL